MAPQPAPPPFNINQLISMILTKRGGSDFSSMSVDPVLQYLNGNFQQNQRFTLDDLYARNAPTFSSTLNLPDESPFKIAAARIREGIPYWEVVASGDLQSNSGMDPDEWKKFVDTLVAEQKTVNAEMMDQNTTQDYFEKQGMHGARDSWLDKNTDGSLKFVADARQFAPQQFDELRANLPAQLTADTARHKSIDDKYGAPVMETDRDKMLKMFYDESLAKRNSKELEKVKGKRTYSIDPITGLQVAKWDNPNPRGMGDDLSYVDGKSIPWFNDSGIWDDKSPDVAKQMARSFLRMKGSQWFGLKPLVDRIATSIGANNPRDQRAFAMLDAQKLLKAQGSAGMENKAATARSKAYGNFLKSLGDRTQGSAVNTQRQEADLAMQVLASLAKQGSTPLNNDIMKNVILRRSTNSG